MTSDIPQALARIGENLAILLSLTLAFGALRQRFRQAPAWLGICSQGLLFSTAGVICMSVGVPFSNHVHDARDIVVLASGYFGGPGVALISGTLVAAYRVHIVSGPGALPGGISVLIAMVVGLAMRHHHERRGLPVGPRALLETGVAHAALGMVALFGSVGQGVTPLIGLVIFAIRVVLQGGGFLLLGTLISLEEQRRDAQQALRVSVERYDLAAAGAKDALWDWDLRTDQVFYAPRWRQMLGLDRHCRLDAPQDWLGRVHPQDLPALQSCLQAHLEQGSPLLEAEYRMAHADGTYRHVATRGIAVRDAQGTATRLAGSTTDITERRAAEAEQEAIEQRLQEAQRLESLGMLAGGVAHDFNNLLTGVMGNASLLQLQSKDEEQRRLLQQIETAAERAAELCRQLLDYAGRSRREARRLDFDALVKETAQLSDRTRQARCDFELDLGTASAHVRADGTQVRQVVMNLIANAVDALGDQRGRVAVRTRRRYLQPADIARLRVGSQLPAGEYVELSVEDTGQGMTPAVLDRIFDPFFSTKPSGRGLGLAAVLGILRRHRGGMRVDSAVGKGTRFVVVLPVDAPQDTEVAPTSLPSLGAAPPHGKVLVVDDEYLIREMAARTLQQAGLDVITAQDGAQALEQLQREDPDLVLLDIKMPSMDGAEVLERIRAGGLAVPVLLMSGFHEDRIADKARRSDYSGMLSKPFRAEELLQRVREVLSVAHPPVEAVPRSQRGTPQAYSRSSA